MAKRKPKMSFSDALNLVDGDMPDGAYFAMAEELSGMDLCDGIEQMQREKKRDDAASLQRRSQQPAPSDKPFACPTCGKRFREEHSVKQHRNDAHQDSRQAS